MKKKKILSGIEQGGFMLFIFARLANKLWLNNEYIETLTWTILFISLFAAVRNREGKRPLVLTIDLIFAICTLLIIISDIISYLR